MSKPSRKRPPIPSKSTLERERADGERRKDNYVIREEFFVYNLLEVFARTRPIKGKEECRKFMKDQASRCIARINEAKTRFIVKDCSTDRTKSYAPRTLGDLFKTKCYYIDPSSEDDSSGEEEETKGYPYDGIITLGEVVYDRDFPSYYGISDELHFPDRSRRNCDLFNISRGLNSKVIQQVLDNPERYKDWMERKLKPLFDFVTVTFCSHPDKKVTSQEKFDMLMDWVAYIIKHVDKPRTGIDICFMKGTVLSGYVFTSFLTMRVLGVQNTHTIPDFFGSYKTPRDSASRLLTVVDFDAELSAHRKKQIDNVTNCIIVTHKDHPSEVIGRHSKRRIQCFVTFYDPSKDNLREMADYLASDEHIVPDTDIKVSIGDIFITFLQSKPYGENKPAKVLETDIMTELYGTD